MAGAATLFLAEQGGKMLISYPALTSGLEIIFVSACVNAACVVILLRMRDADRKLLSSTPETNKPGL